LFELPYFLKNIAATATTMMKTTDPTVETMVIPLDVSPKNNTQTMEKN